MAQVITTMGKAYNLNQCTLYGGGFRDVYTTNVRWDYIIALATVPVAPKIKILGSEMLGSLLTKVNAYNTNQDECIIQLDWPDMRAPSYPRSFWHALYTDLASLQSTNGKPINVAICCGAGIGRTGTTLAILAGLMGEKEPVKFVRKVYYDKAVETQDQIYYIEDILGIKLKDKGSHVGALSIGGQYDITGQAATSKGFMAAKKDSTYTVGGYYENGQYHNPNAGVSSNAGKARVPARMAVCTYCGKERISSEVERTPGFKFVRDADEDIFDCGCPQGDVPHVPKTKAKGKQSINVKS